jgi:hypothetical protein
MYDGTDVALVLGWLLSAVLAGLSLISAVISLGFFVVQKSKNATARASFAGGLAVLLFVAAVLCGISFPSGYATYEMFEHRRGFSNPPGNVIAVAIASVSGPVAASILVVVWVRRRKNKPGGDSSNADPVATPDRDGT